MLDGFHVSFSAVMVGRHARDCALYHLHAPRSVLSIANASVAVNAMPLFSHSGQQHTAMTTQALHGPAIARVDPRVQRHRGLRRQPTQRLARRQFPRRSCREAEARRRYPPQHQETLQRLDIWNPEWDILSRVDSLWPKDHARGNGDGSPTPTQLLMALVSRLTGGCSCATSMPEISSTPHHPRARVLGSTLPLLKPNHS